MASFGRWNSHSYGGYGPPPAPLMPDHARFSTSYGNLPGAYQSTGQLYGGGYGSPASFYCGQPSAFPPGTDPDVVGAFQMVDKDMSGFIDENELRQALSSGYQRFDMRTVRLLMFLFRNPRDPQRLGPREFAAVWSCLKQWRGIFERFDRDRSGKMDPGELREALYSLGYTMPPSVLQVLISRYDDGSGRQIELNFDSFVECGMIVKGLTEKFAEKDVRYAGSVTVGYDTFMSMVIPFLVSYN